MSGWIKLDRAITSHDIWQNEVFTRGQAWVDLLLHANHGFSTVRLKGRKINLKPGQQLRSEGTLAITWKWSRGKVRRFLGELENDKMVVQQSVQVTSLITICNYCHYQGNHSHDGTENSTQDRTPDSTESEQTSNTVKNVKNVKNVKKLKDSIELPGMGGKTPDPKEKLFEEFWDIYPKKADKKKAKILFMKITDIENVLVKIKSNIEARLSSGSWKLTDMHFIKYPTGYLNGEMWNDEISNSSPINQQQIDINDGTFCE